MNVKEIHVKAKAAKKSAPKKQATKKPVAATPKTTVLKKPAPIKEPKTSREVLYKIISEPTTKQSPQATVILDILAKHRKEGVKRKQLIEELKSLLKTRQPVERVLAYYAVVLKHEGVLGVEKL